MSPPPRHYPVDSLSLKVLAGRWVTHGWWGCQPKAGALARNFGGEGQPPAPRAVAAGSLSMSIPEGSYVRVTDNPPNMRALLSQGVLRVGGSGE